MQGEVDSGKGPAGWAWTPKKWGGDRIKMVMEWCSTWQEGSNIGWSVHC